MIKANKCELAISGELEIVMAEFMCITAHMIETFGEESTISMVGIVLEEMAGDVEGVT